MDEMRLPPTPAGPRSPAFTLIELLLVISIAAILMTLVAPKLNSIAMGSNLTRAGQLVGDEIARARQEAVTGNLDVKVVFFYLPATNGRSTAGWAGMQIWRVVQTNNGPSDKPLSRVVTFPQGVNISPPDTTTLSPLLTGTAITGTTSLPAYGSVPYVGFRFRANGATDSSVTGTNNFLTLQNANTKGPVPANYYTIQVNPLTGKVTVFRP